MPVGRPKGSKNKTSAAKKMPLKTPQIAGPAVLQNQVSSTGRKGGAAGATLAGRKAGSSRAQGSSAGMQGNLPGWDSQQYAAMVQQHQGYQAQIKELQLQNKALQQQVLRICTHLSRLGSVFIPLKTARNT